MEIRVLTASDALDYWNLRLESLENEPRAFSSSAEEHRTLSLDQAAERIRPAEGGSFVFGAFDGGKLVGTAGFWRERQPKLRHKGFVWGVYVQPGYRGRGLARSLMSALLERVRGYPDLLQVNLAVAATQVAAERLYGSLGFEQFGNEPRGISVGGELVDEHWMTLRLRDSEAGSG